MNNNNVQNILKEDLCIGCGICSAICPRNAIEMVIDKKSGLFVPQINKSKCIGCKKCLLSCSSFFSEAEKMACSGKKDDFIGDFLNLYKGFSLDTRIRLDSSSGGIVTSVLIFALENKMVDGAIVTKMDEKNPLMTKTFIAENKEDIIKASQSKYCPVNFDETLKKVMNSNKRYAFVGLPCHIRGIKKAELVNNKLKGKIVLHIGLFCDHMVNFIGTETLLEKFKLKKCHIEKLEYRFWNGKKSGMKIDLKNKQSFFIPSEKYWGCLFELYFFTPKKCIVCDDFTSEYADISCGDAWIKNSIKEKKYI